MSEIDIKTRVDDSIRLSDSRGIPKFLGFLSSAESAEAREAVGFHKHGFFGGYEGAQRTVLGIFPDWDEGNECDYPIIAVTFRYRKTDKLSHRDFLGALMALGIKRSSVGDILIGEGEAVVFVLRDISEYVVSQISRIGAVGVSVEVGKPAVLPTASDFIEGSGTVASLRLDCVVSELSGKSRGAAAEFIEAGYVSVNSSAVCKTSANIKAGDIVTLRGKGKFIIVSACERSKKGRIILRWKKYN